MTGKYKVVSKNTSVLKSVMKLHKKIKIIRLLICSHLWKFQSVYIWTSVSLRFIDMRVSRT